MRGPRLAPIPVWRWHEGKRRRLLAGVLAAVVASLVVGPMSPRDPRSAAGAGRPNVVLIVTDDQRWDSLWAMPNVHALLEQRGVRFTNAIVPTPVCCPSRAAILTGTYPHTNGVWRNAAPNGGFESFDDRSTLATWLDDAGYRTGLFGKYLNGYRRTDGRYVPSGWDRWVAFETPRYYDYRLSYDGHPVAFGSAPDEYSTAVLARELRDFVSSGGDAPFFAVFAPYAPHKPATPAAGDEDAFPNTPLPSSEAFDEPDVGDKPAYVRSLPRLGRKRVTKLVETYRKSLRSLLAVDRAVAGIVEDLQARGEMRDTIVIFTSDNGLAFGEHRWTAKRVPYEESIRVPLVIRYDARGTGGTSTEVVANVDIAPTIVALTGVSAPPMDGVSLDQILRDTTSALPREGVLLEYLAKKDDEVPTYCGYRTEDHVYVRYSTGEEELYDLGRDPDQLQNGAGDNGERSLLVSMRSVAQAQCQPPDHAFRWRRP